MEHFHFTSFFGTYTFGLPDFDQLSLHIAPNTRSTLFIPVIDYITETVDLVGTAVRGYCNHDGYVFLVRRNTISGSIRISRTQYHQPNV